MPNKPLIWDIEAPLEPIETEPPHINAAMRRYYMMGGDRSLRKLAETFKEEKKLRERGDTSIPAVHTTSFHTLSAWSRQWDWVNRCLQKDYLDNKKKQREWETRQEQVREDDWQHSSKLRQLAWRVINVSPSFIRKSRKVVDEGSPRVVDMEGKVLREGRPREVVVTVSLSVNDLVKVEKLASRLARLATEMDQGRSSIQLQWREEAQRAGISQAELYERVVAEFTEMLESSGGEPTDSGGVEGGSETDDDDTV